MDERSINSVVAILGILKAGAAFVPLDADWPALRLAFVLDDSSIALVVTRSSHTEDHASLPCEFICWDELHAVIDELEDIAVGGRP